MFLSQSSYSGLELRTNLVGAGAGSREGLMDGWLEAHEGPGDGVQGSDFSMVSSPGSGSA